MSPHIKRFITAWIIGSLFWTIFFYCPSYIFSATLLGILATIICTEWGKIFPKTSAWFWLTMPVYPILPFAMIIYMNELDLYRPLVYYLFLIVFSFDAGAYITGSLFGKMLIAPQITPKKTVEGFIGGYLSAVVVFVYALYTANNHLSPRFVLALTLLICTIAFFGDLLESSLKRMANIKDSGDILPGHGGFLDRFDAVMLTSFFFFLCRDWLITFLK